MSEGHQAERRAFALPRKIAVAGVGALALIFGAFAAYAFAASTTRSVDEKIPYQHSGSFEYSAPVPNGPVYDGTELVTGDPIYLNLTNSLMFDFSYGFTADAPHTVEGSGRLVATVSDSDGWEHRFPLAPERSLGEDGTLVLSGELNLGAIRSLTNRVERATGLTRDAYNVSVQPMIEVAATVAGTDVTESFSPALAFTLTDLAMIPTPDAAGGDPFVPGQGGAAQATTVAPRSLSVGPLEVGVSDARRVALLGLGVAIAALAVALMLQASPVNVPENGRIRARYGSRLVPVMTPPPSRSEVVELSSIGALVRIAEGYERMILHHSAAGIDSYFIDNGGHVYLYRTAADDAVAMLSVSIAAGSEGSDDS